MSKSIATIVIVGAIVGGGLFVPRSAAAQTPGNDPWSWCNFHSYSQPVSEEECEEELSEPLPTPAPPLPINPGPTATPMPPSYLRSLLEQHALMNSYYLEAYFDKRDDTQYWQQTLDANTQALGVVIGASRGQNDQTALIQLLEQQTVLLTHYVDAVKIGSENSTGVVRSQLNDNSSYLAQFFQNQNHSAADLKILFNQQANDETSIVDNYALGNQSAITDLLNQAVSHADAIADAVSGPSGNLAPTVSPTP